MIAIQLNIDQKTLSHELRTPLTKILGLSEVLSREMLSKEQLKIVRAIKDAGIQLLSLIDVILSSPVTEQKSKCVMEPAILLIEDEPIIQLIHCQMLKDL